MAGAGGASSRGGGCPGSACSAVDKAFGAVPHRRLTFAMSSKSLSSSEMGDILEEVREERVGEGERESK